MQDCVHMPLEQRHEAGLVNQEECLHAAWSAVVLAYLRSRQSLPWPPGGEHAPQQHTKGIHIRSLGQLALHQQLWRHVRHRATGLQHQDTSSMPVASLAYVHGKTNAYDGCILIQPG